MREYDLQVYTKLEFRRKNIIYNAFQNTIFPHLKLSRKSQNVTTTEDNLGARKLINKLGFKLIDHNKEKLIYNKSLRNINPIEFSSPKLDQAQLVKYQHNILQCFEIIYLISKHLELSGNQYELSKSISQILKYRWKIINEFDNDINPE